MSMWFEQQVSHSHVFIKFEFKANIFDQCYCVGVGDMASKSTSLICNKGLKAVITQFVEKIKQLERI
jgi:hypothetical protein